MKKEIKKLFRVIEDRGCNVVYTVAEGLGKTQALSLKSEMEMDENTNGNGDPFVYIIERYYEKM